MECLKGLRKNRNPTESMAGGDSMCCRDRDARNRIAKNQRGPGRTSKWTGVPIGGGR